MPELRGATQIYQIARQIASTAPVPIPEDEIRNIVSQFKSDTIDQGDLERALYAGPTVTAWKTKAASDAESRKQVETQQAADTGRTAELEDKLKGILSGQEAELPAQTETYGGYITDPLQKALYGQGGYLEQVRAKEAAAGRGAGAADAAAAQELAKSMVGVGEAKANFFGSNLNRIKSAQSEQPLQTGENRLSRAYGYDTQLNAALEAAKNRQLSATEGGAGRTTSSNEAQNQRDYQDSQFWKNLLPSVIGGVATTATGGAGSLIMDPLKKLLKGNKNG